MGKGRVRKAMEKGKRKGDWNWEEGKGKEKREEGRGKKGRRRGGKENQVKNWESGEGNRVSVTFTRPW